MRLLRALLCLWLLAEAALASRVRTRRELGPGLYEHGVYDAGGSYCQRGDVCCHGRNDGCTVPYHDTLCYCDLFCNRTISDCCPDFWEYCLGIPAPFPKAPGCARAGRNYPTGATYRENCNLCTCGPGGQWQCEDHACLMDGELIDAVNRGNYGWRAANYSQFWGMTLEDGIRYRLGTFRPSPTVMNMNEMHMNMDSNEVLPRHFDAAAKWPGMIHEPLDQGNCAGSWAFSTAAVASDRISIHSMGHMKPALSPQNLLSCDTRNQRGCSGGRLDGAWWYLRRRGVVTDECYPFTSQESQPVAQPCMMHSRSTGRGKRQATARCPNPQTHANEIYQSTPAYRLSSSEKEIMKELLENGPVQAILEVHEDFFMYKSGIYRHTPVAEGKRPKHQRHGTHSVKITGPRPTPGARRGARAATFASPAASTSAKWRPSWWASGAVSAWRTCPTSERPAAPLSSHPGAPPSPADVLVPTMALPSTAAPPSPPGGTRGVGPPRSPVPLGRGMRLSPGSPSPGGRMPPLC
ncbi:tubulointerstitial nephritis antigen-like isoform X1 [Aquila chrysaetos chrysaetos]|uniref:tubulointerstitial nephritis antigen-like isoform X1 n=1 Tax=Aquila chrysaetos chrysaetos TaxID=223781 RepID=UPI001B7D3926|nr:tubulointerstitial nephritis antigen-like isoform X1 [Aquila chrysaetos chrysaetos]